MTVRSRRSRSKGGAAERIPRYLQVASALRSRILQGYWDVGGQIATIEVLEREFDVARITVRQAIDLLVSEGLVRSIQGKGTFVERVPGDVRWLKLATSWDSLINPIRENVPQKLIVSDSGPPRLADGDGRPAAAYKFLESVQVRKREPFAIARVHVSADIFARSPDRFRIQPALGAIADMSDLAIGRAHQTLVIAMADVETARLLRIGLNAPIVEARCVVTDAVGIAIYIGAITYRGDCVKLDIDLIGR